MALVPARTLGRRERNDNGNDEKGRGEMARSEQENEQASDARNDGNNRVGFMAGMAPGKEDTALFLWVVSQIRQETFAATVDGCWYQWDVTRANQLLDARNAPIEGFRASDFDISPEHLRERYPDLDIGYARQLTDEDLQRPLLFLPFGGKHQLIDGWHRLYKAVTSGIDTLPVRVLTDAEAAQVLVESRSVKH